MWLFILFIAIFVLVSAIVLYTFVTHVVENENAFLMIVGIFLVVYMLAAFLVYKFIGSHLAPSNFGSFLHHGWIQAGSSR